MNEAMKQAWMEIIPMLGDLTNEELTVFLHTWQRALQAEREACAKVADLVAREIDDTNRTATYIAAAIRARGNT